MKDLKNKSVVITWTESITEKGEDGRVMTHPANRERIAYISSTGRIFLRATNNLPGGQGVYENAPGASPAGSLAFQGSNTMVGTSVWPSAFRRMFSASLRATGALKVRRMGRTGRQADWAFSRSQENSAAKGWRTL